MEIDKFQRMVQKPSRTEDELKSIFENARRSGSAEHVAVVREVLDTRFPGWDVIKTRRGGSTPNWPSFRGDKRFFKTAKEGYLWLVERFIAEKRELFVDPSSETLYLALGRSRNYFAKSPSALFKGSLRLADDASNYARLPNGWYANVNLNNAQKFEILFRFAGLTKTEYLVEWDWEVSGATELLANKQHAAIEAQRIRKELEKLFPFLNNG